VREVTQRRTGREEREQVWGEFVGHFAGSLSSATVFFSMIRRQSQRRSRSRVGDSCCDDDDGDGADDGEDALSSRRRVGFVGW
jgi:hypothetical protein